MTARKQGQTDQIDTGVTRGVVAGLFSERSDAERAIRALKDAGFSENQIGVAMRDRGEQRDLVNDTGTKAAEGAATGAASGGVVGGVLGLLAGVGALAIPGVGPIVAGGVLASTLTGAGIGAAAGGIIGGLIGMGIPEEEARHFDQGFRAGGILVTVEAGARADEARDILRTNAADLGPAWARQYPGDVRGRTAARSTEADREHLELREEELRVEKERIQAGEVRLRKEVVTEKRSIDVPVTREEVVIERRPVEGREARTGDIDEGEEIRIPVMEERVHVEKEPVVREEVTLGKRRVEDTERVSETVRREEARIESEGRTNVTGGGTAQRGRQSQPERRKRRDPQYAGPERRMAGV